MKISIYSFPLISQWSNSPSIGEEYVYTFNESPTIFSTVRVGLGECATSGWYFLVIFLRNLEKKNRRVLTSYYISSCSEENVWIILLCLLTKLQWGQINRCTIISKQQMFAATSKINLYNNGGLCILISNLLLGRWSKKLHKSSRHARLLQVDMTDA